MFETNKIYNEDCFQTMKRMQDNNILADLILTSPPYNMTKRKGGLSDSGRYDVYNDWKPEEEYLNWSVNLFNEFDKVLKPNRAIIYNFSYSIENPSLPYKLVTKIVQETPFELIDTIVWKKKCGLPFPANGKRLSRIWEFLFVFVRKYEVSTYENNREVKSISEKTGQKYYEVAYNLIEANNTTIRCPQNQATFSIELCEEIFKLYAKDNWLVYDPLIGSGTTAVACKKNGMQYIGSEISKQQVDFANQRLSED